MYSIRFVLLFLLLFPFSLSHSHSQDKKGRQDIPDRPTFRLPVNLVVVNATVIDKDGHPVTDLTQDDFRVYEDGKLQPIQTFAMESYDPAQLEKGARLERPAAIRAAPEVPRGNRPRLISIVIDDITAASRSDFPRIAEAVTKFIQEDIGADDQVSMSAASGRVQFPFSGDKQELLEEINTILAKLNVDGLTKADCPTLTDLQAKRIAEFTDVRTASAQTPRDSTNPILFLRQTAEQSMNAIRDIEDVDARVALEETILCLTLDPSDERSVPTAKAFMRTAAFRQNQEQEYRAGTLLDNLHHHLRSLKHFDATKSLILFSDGFISEGVSHISYKLQDVVDQALLSGVVLNAVDSRGLYTPMLPAEQAAVSLFSSTAQQKQALYLEDMSAQEGPLARMTNDTGGLFYHNSNDMYAGLEKIVHRQSFYYVLTYAMPSQKSDGRFHQIKVELSRPGFELSYRKGYYAPKEELTFERRKKEDIMEALRAPGNLNEIPLALAYNYYQEDASTYALALSANFSIRGLHFLDEDSRRKNLIHLVVAAFDEMDHYVDGIEKSIDFKLTEASYANILAYGINSSVEFKLPMGRYKIKAVVREGAGGKMGSATRTLEIP